MGCATAVCRLDGAVKYHEPANPAAKARHALTETSHVLPCCRAAPANIAKPGSGAAGSQKLRWGMSSTVPVSVAPNESGELDGGGGAGGSDKSDECAKLDKSDKSIRGRLFPSVRPIGVAGTDSGWASGSVELAGPPGEQDLTAWSRDSCTVPAKGSIRSSRAHRTCSASTVVFGARAAHRSARSQTKIDHARDSVGHRPQDFTAAAVNWTLPSLPATASRCET